MFTYEAIVQNLLEGGILEFLDMVQDGVIPSQSYTYGRMTSQECSVLLADLLINRPELISLEAKSGLKRDLLDESEGDDAYTWRQAEFRFNVLSVEPLRREAGYAWFARRASGQFYIENGKLQENFLTIIVKDDGDIPDVSLQWSGGSSAVVCFANDGSQVMRAYPGTLVFGTIDVDLDRGYAIVADDELEALLARAGGADQDDHFDLILVKDEEGTWITHHYPDRLPRHR